MTFKERRPDWVTATKELDDNGSQIRRFYWENTMGVQLREVSVRSDLREFECPECKNWEHLQKGEWANGHPPEYKCRTCVGRTGAREQLALA